MTKSTVGSSPVCEPRHPDPPGCLRSPTEAEVVNRAVVVHDELVRAGRDCVDVEARAAALREAKLGRAYSRSARLVSRDV